MANTPSLGEFEQIVLLAVLRLGDEAYGVTILNEIAAKTGRNPSPGALYTTLHRMEDKGLVTFRDGSPTPERGGRAKRFVTVTREGRNAVASAQAAYRSLLEGLDLLPEPARFAEVLLAKNVTSGAKALFLWKSLCGTGEPVPLTKLHSGALTVVAYTGRRMRVPQVSLLRPEFGASHA